ncbi:hypothetical protein H5410_047999 [Solanum commersonii]|uniref:Uncharacterized protein n=1 Tax=Solanum commersonii TaxID=4109 RepID=A0A9J5XIJ1_SOLCO|nr:hypothetical protein H5410_047999 [Solanum commersonii]
MFEFARKLQKRGGELISECCSEIGVEKWGFKGRLHNRTPSIDILSNADEHFSKTWLQAWSTLPNLDFTVDFSKGNDMKIVDDIMGRYRDGKIPIEKFELSMIKCFVLLKILMKF